MRGSSKTSPQPIVSDGCNGKGGSGAGEDSGDQDERGGDARTRQVELQDGEIDGEDGREGQGDVGEGAPGVAGQDAALQDWDAEDEVAEQDDGEGGRCPFAASPACHGVAERQVDGDVDDVEPKHEPRFAVSDLQGVGQTSDPVERHGDGEEAKHGGDVVGGGLVAAPDEEGGVGEGDDGDAQGEQQGGEELYGVMVHLAQFAVVVGRD